MRALRIKKGETIDTLAEKFHVTAEQIRRSNGMPPSAKFNPGDRVLIPERNDTNIIN